MKKKLIHLINYLSLKKFQSFSSIPTIIYKKIQNLFDKYNLLTYGFKYSLHKNATTRKNNAIIYAIHNSLPETNNGYAIRSHYIARSIKSIYENVYPVTRLGFPYDLPNLSPYAQSQEFCIDEIIYLRLRKEGFHFGDIPTSIYIHNYADILAELALNKGAILIHGASNYLNGLAVINAAKIVNIPSIYEVRGFWEITRASREKNFKGSNSFKMQKKLEIQACQDATSVIALSEIVKEELINRGIKKEKIYVVPNGIDTDKLSIRDKSKELLSKYNLKHKFIIGFIGSIVDYEGLFLLIKASEKIYKLGNDNIRFLIVGDGNHFEYLKNEVKNRSLSKLFIFTGRVPYEKVGEYYSILDIACYPRLDWEVCSIVSPKKPFEAMSYGVPIISSSVRANSYFIKDGFTGLIHKKEDVDSLINTILKLYLDKDLRAFLSLNAREWVVNNRDISITSKLLQSIYLKTINKFNMSKNV